MADECYRCGTIGSDTRDGLCPECDYEERNDYTLFMEELREDKAE